MNGHGHFNEADEQFETLRRRALHGSMDEIAALLCLYRPYLKRLASRKLSPELRAKEGSSDLVQRTIIDGQAGFANCTADSPASFRLWLRRILVNNLHDTRRRFETKRRALYRERPLDDPECIRLMAESAKTVGETPSGMAISQEEEKTVRNAMKKLSAEHREALVLHYEDQLNYREMAQLLECSRGTAHSRVIQARQALKRIIGESIDWND